MTAVGRRAATWARFRGPRRPNFSSRFTFWPEATSRASAFAFSSPRSLNLLIPCQYLASAKSGSIHTLRFLSASSWGKVPR